MTTRVFGAVAPDATEVFLTNGDSVESALASVSSGINVYNTYTELQQDVGSAGQVVHARGRDSIGDLGGGFFEWLSGNESANVTADPLKVLYVPPASDTTGASGVWYRLNNGTYYTSWAGLGNNSPNDESAKLQSIFDQIGDYETWKFNKDFSVASVSTLSNVIGVTLDGQGCQITETGNIEGTITLSSCLRTKLLGFRVFGDESESTFDYSQSIGPNYTFAQLTSCDDCVAEYNIISGKSGGIKVTGGSNTRMAHNKHLGIFITPRALSDTMNGAASFFISGGSNNIIDKNYSRNAGTAILLGGDPDYPQVTNNFTINDNDNGIYISTGNRVLVQGNTSVDSRRGSGVKVRGNQCRVIGNTFRNNFIGITITGEYGATLDAFGTLPERSIVEANHIEGCGIGINFDSVPNPTTGDPEYPRDTICRNNHVLNCGGPNISGSTYLASPIRVKGGLGIVISGNIIEGKIDAAVEEAIAIYYNPTPGLRNSGFIVSDNILRGDFTSFIDAFTVDDSEFSNNRVASGTVTYLFNGDDVKDSVISFNYNPNGQAVRILSDCTNNIITHNKGTSNTLLSFIADNYLFGNYPVANPANERVLSLNSWVNAPANQRLTVTATVRAYSAGTASPGQIDVEINESGGTFANYSFIAAFSDGDSDVNFSVANTVTFSVPAGGSYRLRNVADPDGTNSITKVVETLN